MVQGLFQVEGVATVVRHLQGEHHRARRAGCSGQGIAQYAVHQGHATRCSRGNAAGIAGQGEVCAGIRPHHQFSHAACSDIGDAVQIIDTVRQIVFVDITFDRAGVLDMNGQGSGRRVAVVINDDVVECLRPVAINLCRSLITPGTGIEVE